MTNPYDDIRRERVRQDAIHGREFPVDKFAQRMGEELGEICEALEDNEHLSRVREEVTQLGALCVKAMQQIDRMLGETDEPGSRPRDVGFPTELLVKGGDE